MNIRAKFGFVAQTYPMLVVMLGSGLASNAVAQVTVAGDTLSWPSDGWYQVQRADNYETVCEAGTGCSVEPGKYNVINRTTRQRWDGVQVLGSNAPSIVGQTLSWPDNGWYQVQQSSDYLSVCEGGTSCLVDAGLYIIINHTTGERWEDLRVEANLSPTVEGNAIVFMDNSWYQVLEADSYASICEGRGSCEVNPGNYTVINHTTGQRIYDVEVAGDSTQPTDTDPVQPDGAQGYEVWAADQSNSVAGQDLGRLGSYIWIWDSTDIENQISGGPNAVPIGCGDNDGNSSDNVGPCDLLDVFPQNLVEYDGNGDPTGNTLADVSGFGRLHGLIPDPQNQYFTANIFAPSGGYVAIIDARNKEAVALFRVTEMEMDNSAGRSVNRSVHMSFWRPDGSGIIVANLHGKTLERVDVTRNDSGKITGATFNRSASLGLGKGMVLSREATVFLGMNQNNTEMLGSVIGDYADADLGDLTPNGECKENGCSTGPTASNGGRPNNVVICPIPSFHDKGYVTLGAGGLIIADLAATPMTIVGEYGNEVVNGPGCAGAQSGDQVWLNAGVSASGAGFDQSGFTLYVFDDTAYESGPNLPDSPLPQVAFKDSTNTSHLGNLDGLAATNVTGQLPGTTTRRDGHGAATTMDGRYVHNVDRIQNVVEVFDTTSVGSLPIRYDLTSADGQGGEELGPCEATSVVDDLALPSNDPAPDLLQATPDGRYMAVAFRGPAPVTVNHTAQGSCPGVGIIELTESGQSGKLVTVLRTTNTLDTAATTAPGGVNYAGAERSDVHGASVIAK